MRVKKFDDYLKKRLNPEEIQEIKDQTNLEYESIKTKNDLSKILK
jgi:hypothetical protein